MPTRLVGILNLTPDSFSDGGSYTDLSSLLISCTTLIKEGAAVIDIGAESTRPNAIPLSAKEEWQRLAPYLKSIINHIHQLGALASLDSRHPENVQRAVDLGIDWMNDVSGLSDQAMIDVAASSHVSIVVMHSVSIPAERTMTIPDDIDPILYLKQWLDTCISHASAAGIDKQRLIFDPGIGFGKNVDQCWSLINRADELKAFGYPLFIGHSRKGFLAPDKAPKDRDPETCRVSAQLCRKQVDYLRVHNVISNKLACISLQ
ncbi:MAG: dihydropteroate synthase [Alphaproteobacteria bacterium]|nr:dihydropteroate synthase [Alphaproteobacteria bacterium]